MKLTTVALSLLAIIGAGCATDPSAPMISASGLPDCFAANYDAQRDLFTMKNTPREAVNEQCLLTIGSGSRLGAGSYAVSVANGGGGGAGAGGTVQLNRGGGGGGGAGAGAKENQTTVKLTEGVYKLTIGGGGPGGHACVPSYNMGGGPGWAGSPSSIVRVANGEVVAGTPGADLYARPSRAQHDQSSRSMNGNGGSGPGQSSGGRGGTSNSSAATVLLAESGQNSRATGAGTGGTPGATADRWLALGGGGPTTSGDGNDVLALSGAGFDAPTASIERGTAPTGGIPGGNEDRSSAGGGGGATSIGAGGGGGGESPGHANRAPQRGSLGSGGGGGEGSRFECDAGARGGHGFIALRPL
jgi:hypothetical protein